MTAIDLMVARKELVEDLSTECCGIEPRQVIIDDPLKGVSVKYVGPHMSELWLSLEIPFNPEQSTLELLRKCDDCGFVEYRILGIEEPSHEEKIGDRWEMVARSPRSEGMGVLIPSTVIGRNDFFGYGNGLQMCTQRAKDYIDKNGWSNIEFVEYGEVILD